MFQLGAVPQRMLAARYAVLNNDFVFQCSSATAANPYMHLYISFFFFENHINNVLHFMLPPFFHDDLRLITASANSFSLRSLAELSKPISI